MPVPFKRPSKPSSLLQSMIFQALHTSHWSTPNATAFKIRTGLDCLRFFNERPKSSYMKTEGKDKEIKGDGGNSHNYSHAWLLEMNVWPQCEAILPAKILQTLPHTCLFSPRPGDVNQEFVQVVSKSFVYKRCVHIPWIANWRTHIQSAVSELPNQSSVYGLL